MNHELPEIKKEPLQPLSLVLSFSHILFTALLIHYLVEPPHFLAKELKNISSPTLECKNAS